MKKLVFNSEKIFSVLMIIICLTLVNCEGNQELDTNEIKDGIIEDFFKVPNSGNSTSAKSSPQNIENICINSAFNAQINYLASNFPEVAIEILSYKIGRHVQKNNGNYYPENWELKNDGNYYPENFSLKNDGNYYPKNWTLKNDGNYYPENFSIKNDGNYYPENFSLKNDGVYRP
jgi:hypothetical protein